MDGLGIDTVGLFGFDDVRSEESGWIDGVAVKAFICMDEQDATPQLLNFLNFGLECIAHNKGNTAYFSLRCGPGV